MYYRNINPADQRIFPGIGFGLPFLTGLAAGAILAPGPGFGYGYPYRPFRPYLYPPYPYMYPYYCC